MTNWFKDGLAQLDLNNKLVLGGSAGLVISVFLPWYSDVDTFNTGNTFLGITGPLYLAGLLVMLSGFFTLSMIVMKIMGKPVPKLPLSQKHMNITLGALSMLMIILSMSVYFHSDFGINLTDKSAGVGMLTALFSTLIVIGGTLLPNEKAKVLYEHDEHLRNIVDEAHLSREPAEIENREPKHVDLKEMMNESIGSLADSESKTTNNEYYDR